MEQRRSEACVLQSRRSRFVVTASLVAALTSGAAALGPAVALADELPDTAGGVAVETVVVEAEASASEPATPETPSAASDPVTADPAAADPAAGNPAAAETPSAATDPAATGDPVATDPTAADPAAGNPAAAETPSDATDPAAGPTTENPAGVGEQAPSGVPVALDAEGSSGETEVAEKPQVDIVFVVDSHGWEYYTLDDAAGDVYGYAQGMGDGTDARFALYTISDPWNGYDGSYYFVPLEDGDGVWTSDPAALRDGLKGSDAAYEFGVVGTRTPHYVPAEMLAALYASEDGAWRDGARRYVVLISDDYNDEYLLAGDAVFNENGLDQNGDGEIDQSEWPRGEGSLDSVAREHLANGIRTMMQVDWIPYADSDGNIFRMTIVYWQSSETDGDGDYIPGAEWTYGPPGDQQHTRQTAMDWFDPDSPYGELMVVAGPELVEVAENVYEVKRLSEVNEDILLAQAEKDASVYEVENYWWYTYIDGEKTYIMDAHGNLAPGIDQVYWSPEDAAYVVEYKDGEEVLIAESSGKIVALTPESNLSYDRVNLALRGSADSGDGTGADPSDAGSTDTPSSLPNTGSTDTPSSLPNTSSMYAPSSLPNTGSVYADQARESNEKLAETGDATSASDSAALTFAGVAAILAARAAKESKRRDN